MSFPGVRELTVFILQDYRSPFESPDSRQQPDHVRKLEVVNIKHGDSGVRTNVDDQILKCGQIRITPVRRTDNKLVFPCW